MFGTKNIDLSSIVNDEDLGYLQFGAKTQMEIIIDYLKNNEKTLKESAHTFRSFYHLLQKDIEDDEAFADNYFENQEAIEKHSYYFPQLFHNSMMILVQNFFEDYMKQIFSTLANKFNHPTKLPKDINKLRISKLIKMKSYIVKFTGIDFAPMKRKWKQIESLIRYRNFIVHDNSNINNIDSQYRRKQIKKMCKGNSNFLIINDGRLLLVNTHYVLLYMELIKSVTNFIILKSDKILEKNKKKTII